MAVRSDAPRSVGRGSAPADVLVLKGRLIGEPVAHHGPFVMNSDDELRRAYADYRRTLIGG